MKPKLAQMTVAIAIASFAAPALASAAALTEPANTLIPVGAKLTWTSTNMTLKWGFGTVACANVTITGEVTQNSAGVVKGVGSGAGSGTTCTMAGKAATVSDITLSSIEVKKTIIEEKEVFDQSINMTFKMVFNGIECHFESSSIPFTYTAGTDSIRITNGDLTGKPAATCEPGSLNGDFTVETDVSPFTAVILD